MKGGIVMKKRVRIRCILILFLVAGPVAAQKAAASPVAKQLWETPRELMVPESVMYDAVHQVIYVANIAGKPTEKNGQGFISQINLDGTIKKLRWVTGLNAPKGMGIFQNTLYVTDIDQVHAIDITSGKKKETWHAQGAKFLNDIAIDQKGTVYITDMHVNALYAIQKGEIELFMTLQQKAPNGLLMSGGALLVGTADGLFSIDTNSKNINELIKHTGGIDGLKQLADERYIVSDWRGKTQVIEKGKSPVVLIDTTKQNINAADLEFIPSKKLLLIPTFFDNRVVGYQVR